MSDSLPVVPEADCPEAFTGLTVSDPKHVAAGFPAVASSMKHVWGRAGVVRGTRALMMLNQPGGIDCTSCAWPDPDEHRAFAEFCENGAKAIAFEADSRTIGAEFFRDHSVDDLSKLSDYEHGRFGRLAEPLVLRPGSRYYEAITWESAFKLMADELNALASPNEAIFYTSGRTSNEAAFLYQLFVRQFGTNNFPDCSNMCHESSGSALVPTVGIGKGTVKLEDFEKAQVIVILGQNPGTNHPRMLSALQKAKRAGAKIIAVNPLKEAGLLAFLNPQEARGMLGVWSTALADVYLQVKIGGDQALLKGVMKCLLSWGKIDAAFIRDHTTGFDDLKRSLDATGWDAILEQSGLSREEIEAAARVIAESDRIIACWAMGLTQHKHAVATIQDVVNLILLCGSIGKPGAGLCPVRGHSNVQGDRTMGIWEHVPAWGHKLGQEFGFTVPAEKGYDTVEAIRAMHAGDAKVFIGLGGNFLSATPDTQYTAQALKNTRLTVHVSIKLNRSHLVTGRTALILPCLGRTERDVQNEVAQFVTTENSMGVVQSSRGNLAPCSPHLLSETQIVARLAAATLGPRSKTPWDKLAANYDFIRDAISRVVPGFDGYNDRVREPGGFYLPNKPRDGTFPTPTAKANFTASDLIDLKVGPGELVMMTIRTHDQFNTTIYGLEDRYRGIHNERRVVLMNRDDARDRKLKAGDVVDLVGHFRGEQRRANHFIVVEYDIPRGCCATYFPETNVLVPIDSTADVSNTPTSKWVVITVELASRAP
ncbi:FdhF/YdeP family oxidoreductase [Limnoglobus roseus]|uniref:Nitrite reductase n=1 Tax=Limnoglobus roseus TaxID=2598579 RepID=A0A5C1A4W5_9BACT|nr:FdhF/YdeP family oxidoreductase [Limnoglobus roseus]QEL13720.1 nitrite reductase [Limnoglobus roseus]